LAFNIFVSKGNATVDQSNMTVEEIQKLQTEIIQELPAHCTRRQSERLKNILQVEKASAQVRNVFIQPIV